MAPSRGRVAKSGESYMMHQVKTVNVMQLSNDFSRRFLPEQIIQVHRFGTALHIQEKGAAVVKNKLWRWLRFSKVLQSGLDARTVVLPGQHGDIVKPRHLQSPLPADFRFRTLVRFASVSGD